MEEKLLKILQDARPDVNFKEEKSLIDDEVLDSFDIIAIVSEINDVFCVDITADELEAENFNSMEAMIALITNLQSK